MFGASGKTGRAVVAALTGQDVETVGVGRREWDSRGDLVRGCAAAYVIAPNLHPDEPALVTEVLSTLRRARVPRVVYHSVVAPYAPAMPHHLGKAVAEDLVRRSGLDWTVLQPCAYVQNLLPGLGTGLPVRVPYDVNVPFGLVDLLDVGEAAATVLLGDGHRGATYELGGPALVSVRDVADAAGRILDRPVTAERMDPDAWAGTDLNAREREWMRAMFAYYDANGLPAGGRTLSALLGRAGTDLEETLRRELAA